MKKNAFTLTDEKTGNLSFSVHSFENENPFENLQRNNYYTIVIVIHGHGELESGFSKIKFEGKGICCFSPYQPYTVLNPKQLQGIAIHFHSDFFCIYRHQNEVASNGVLFNNAYDSPFISIADDELGEFMIDVSRMKTEVQKNEIAQQEMLILYLKSLLIQAIRIKNRRQDETKEILLKNREAFTLQPLIDAIEVHFMNKHTASDYSDLLGVPSKSLARLTRKHFDKTLTDLISDRIMIEAKRELYLTSKPVKAIAYALGFKDEYYFSRFFKKWAEISPQIYRDTVGSGREALLSA
jgi:AraC family transcriptional activator of pobA